MGAYPDLACLAYKKQAKKGALKMPKTTEMVKSESPQDIEAGQLEKVKLLAENTIKLLESVNVNGSSAFFLVDSLSWLNSMKESCEVRLKRMAEAKAQAERDVQKTFVKAGKKGKS